MPLFGPNGNLYVSNRSANTVSEFTPGSLTPTATLRGLAAPFLMAFDSSGDLYVGNQPIGTVSEFSPGAQTPTETLTGLAVPTTLAFDSSGDLFVANINGGSVSEFTQAPPGPVVTTNSSALTYTVQTGPETVDPGITLSDANSMTIASTTVTISSGYNGAQDSLEFGNQNGITGSFNSNSGTLTLTGTASSANYQTALRSVRFDNTGLSSGTRTVSFVANDGNLSNAPATLAINLVDVAATQLIVTTPPPGSVMAGSNFSLVVTAENAQGTAATGFNGSVTVALAANPGGSTLGGTLSGSGHERCRHFLRLEFESRGQWLHAAILRPERYLDQQRRD